ncbi:polysaccharide deacetylase family protein [Nocardioides sp. W7]|uniref:polysaccharide deacetylase family protein n=1 Tax=Nocardioides sp. W7 TaxID=2931390 RepID=UPI001FD125CA|nr:polysaccharide deacetylase family protein [Nocardioides sp. W7]
MPVLPREPVVLMYHGFCRGRLPNDPENLFVDVDRFEQQLRWLLDQGWRALDLDEYLARRRGGRRLGPRSFLVTIDDGYTSVLDLAVPVLERLGVPALLYVPSDLVGRTARWLSSPADEPLLDADALRHLHGLPLVELGVHGADHSDLRRRPPGELAHQVRQAHDVLADLVGAGVRSFAYPYGTHDPAARAAVAAAGFDVAFSVFDDAGPYAVSRIDVNATDTLASFRLKVQLPHYRLWWSALDRAPVIRRQVRALATRGAGRPR